MMRSDSDPRSSLRVALSLGAGRPCLEDRVHLSICASLEILEIGGNMAMIKYCNRPGCLGAFAEAASVSQERGADSNGWS